MLKKILVFLLGVGVFLTLLFRAPTPTTTILIYYSGADLESQSGVASNDLAEIISAALPERSPVRVVAETGGAREWRMQGISSQRNQRFRITSQGLSLVDDSLGRRSMGDPATLTDFLRWGRENYPADRMVLILCGHGGGPLGGICSDELFAGDSLPLAELTQALEEGLEGHPLDLLALESCMMANAEVALAVAPYARYLGASQESLPGLGMRYRAWLRALLHEPAMDMPTLGEAIVTSMTTMEEHLPISYSIIDLSLADALREALNDLGAACQALLEAGRLEELNALRGKLLSCGEYLGKEPWGLIDVMDLCQLLQPLASEAKALADVTGRAILFRRETLQLNLYVNGLSLYWPGSLAESHGFSAYSQLPGVSPGYAKWIDALGRQYANQTRTAYPGLWQDMEQNTHWEASLEKPYPGLWEGLSSPQ